jgi:Fur family transcriptional regulator, ferric uptake regulator
MSIAGRQRHTRQRQVILEELRNLTSHPTAGALYDVVRRRLPRISLGTVYRNLELLARTGTIQKLEFGGEARFDGCVARHDHLRCVRCGRVDDVSAPPLDLFEGAANDWGGYQILGHRLEFFGICPQCRGRTDDGSQLGGGDSTVAPAVRIPVVPTTFPKPR